MEKDIKEILETLRPDEKAWEERAGEAGRKLVVGKTKFLENSGFCSEPAYKRYMAEKGEITYHCHLCCPDAKSLKKQTDELYRGLSERGLRLDRFGVSVDPAMALPGNIRGKYRAKEGLYFETPGQWELLAEPEGMQAHLGDNMIGSPASFENTVNALKAGITTIGNISQFFGWDYKEAPDVEERTRSMLAAVKVMAAHVEEGALIHSNLDDGYGSSAGDLGLLAGCALLEKYLMEELMGAKLAHSFGDMFYSPEKRLIFLSALTKIHPEGMTGSMIFANKLNRSKTNREVNGSHLNVCLLFDMAGQTVYKTGHAVTVMADEGLTKDVTSEEIIHKLACAKELEGYIPYVKEMIDFNKIDTKAEAVVKRGRQFKDSVLTCFSEFMDIRDPYLVTLAIKKIGMKRLTEAFAPEADEAVIPADYMLYSH